MTSITASLDGDTRLALAVLRRHLTDEGDFSPAAIGRIIDHVRTEGTVDGAPFVRPDEVDALTEVFISAFPAVPYDDPAWGPPPPVVIPDAPDWHVTQLPGYRESLAASGIELVPADGSSLAPISGGSDDDTPPFYEPSPADWADYHAWCDSMDRIDALNADRID